MTDPKISIIIPSFNQGHYIEETLSSIFDQGYSNVEVIVMDGGSSDQTVEILKKYDDRIAHWESVKDRGQSHAINKGVEHATGEIINWLNSDDFLLPGALKAISNEFQKHPEAQIIACQAEKFGKNIDPYVVPRAQNPMPLEQYIFHFWLMQPSCYFRTATFKTLGPINEYLHYCMDTEFFLRYLLMNGVEGIRLVNIPIVRFRLHDESKSIRDQLGFLEERFAIDRKILVSTDLPVPFDPFASETKTSMEPFKVTASINLEQLEEEFIKKWKPYQYDKSLKFRTVANYANGARDRKNTIRYSAKALAANPLIWLNWKYLAKALLSH